MAKASPAATPYGPLPLAVVRLELRAGNGRPTQYEVGDGGFLIGSVPGCDLRLPGANLAPVLALITRHVGGATLRKLAPVQAILVNGRAVSAASLADGDRISVGAVEVAVGILLPPTSATAFEPDVADLRAELAARSEQLRGQAQQLEADKEFWQGRLNEMQTEVRRQGQALQETTQQLRQADSDIAAARADLEAREQALQARQQELDQVRAKAVAHGQQASQQHEEVVGLRRELGTIRQQLVQRYRERRDRLAAREVADHRDCKRLQERQRQLDALNERLTSETEDLAHRQAAIESGTEQLQRERDLLEEQHRLFASRQQENQRELAQRLEEIRARERAVTEERAELEKGQKQHQTDLVRIDRIQATLDQRQKQLQTQALVVDKRFEQLQRDSRELQEQAAQLDDWHTRLTAETERLEAQKREQQSLGSQLDQRAAALESQQAMLATLRTRLERTREEVRRQEQALSDQRALQEAAEADLKQRLEEARLLREGLDNDGLLIEQERKQFAERQVTLDAAIAQMRTAQEALAAEQAAFTQRQQQLDAEAAEQAEQAERLLSRGTQLEELHTRLGADRQALREREAALTRSEQALATLQEQLRRRSDELAEQQTRLQERETRLADETNRLEARAQALAQEQGAGGLELEQRRQELANRTAELDQLERDLLARAETQRAETDRLEEMARTLTTQRQQLSTERIAWEIDKQAAREAAARTQGEWEAIRRETLELSQQFPDLEVRASAGLDRLLRAREQLREHLAEVHTYARQSRDDLETARKEVQAEVERVRQQELGLHTARDEHRLAVAAFRNQLIEWQGQVGEIRQGLQTGEVRLTARRAEVEQQAQQVESASARLAVEAERLQEEQRRVAERRGEVDRHLEDMRSWYRRKIRELSGIDGDPDGPVSDAVLVPMPAAPDGSPRPEGESETVLSLTGEVEPADRQLGDLLHSLELVDSDTLAALLLEARRQRRSLRQLLLAGGYLTLYQIALIEAGNLDGLVLGPVRVIDRLPTTPREAIYRVFDPRHNREALLRHLAESEMADAVRPDEYRQRFASAMITHPHLTATWEVFELAGRPAVLQEWPVGLAGNDWPKLAGAPGVWFRLLTQAGLGVRAIHEAGLVHGHLTLASFVCTRDGVLKVTGMGEPRWLVASTSTSRGRTDAAGDLTALGRAALVWGTDSPRKAGKPRQLPEALLTLAQRLAGDEPGPGFASASALLEELEGISDQVPPNAAAWERFVKQVREESADWILRRSA